MSAMPDSSTLADPQQIIAGLRMELATCRAERDNALRKLDERTTELEEALAQQTATAEVLRVINSSPGDLAPVFDAMLDRGMRLCEAACGGFGVWQGDRYEIVAMRGVPQSFVEFAANNEVSPGPRDGFARVARAEGYIHFSDVSESKFYRSGDPLTRSWISAPSARC